MTDMALMTRAERATHINNLRSRVTLSETDRHRIADELEALATEVERLRAQVHVLSSQRAAREAYGKTLEAGVLAEVVSDPMGGILMVDTHDDLQIDGLQVVLTAPERWRDLLLLESEQGEEECAP